MDFLDAISTDLPAPRDDEPAGMRQDILDELADHLACSYNRELLRGAKPDEARRRAIERFGNPAAMARRLWFDAMKGKIMAQRVLIATCLIVVAACFGIVGLVWSQSNRSAAQAAEANRRLAELLAQTQATNQEMLRRLQVVAKSIERSKTGDWVPVTFKLTVEKPDGPPAVGYQVVLGRGEQGADKEGAMHRQTDATGLADFGVIQPGDWQYRLWAGPWTATGMVNAVPHTPIARTVVCPRAQKVAVRVRIDWPKPLADRNLYALTLFKPKNITYQPLEWYSASSVQFFCGPRGEQLEVALDVGTFGFAMDPKDVDFPKPPSEDDLASGRIYWHRAPEFPKVAPETSEIDGGGYTLARLIVFRPVSREERSPGHQYELLSLVNPSGDAPHISFPIGGVFGHGTMSVEMKGTPISRSWRDNHDHFEARSDQRAEWVIPLPDEMIKEVEKKLKAAG